MHVDVVILLDSKTVGIIKRQVAVALFRIAQPVGQVERYFSTERIAADIPIVERDIIHARSHQRDVDTLAAGISVGTAVARMPTEMTMQVHHIVLLRVDLAFIVPDL